MDVRLYMVEKFCGCGKDEKLGEERMTCLNCIHFDCAEDENGKCIEPYCEKGHDGIDDKTTACGEFERWSVKRQIEKSSKYENSWWKEIK